MSTSRLVTKKRLSNDDQEDNFSTQRSIRRINTSTITKNRKIPDLNLNLISRTGKTRAPGSIRPTKIHDLNMNMISRPRKTRAPGSIRPRKFNDFPKARKTRTFDAENEDADCQLFRELPDSESCMWLSLGSGRSSSPPSFLEDPTFDPLSNLDMSVWKRFLFVLMLLACSKSSFQGKSSLTNGFFRGAVKDEDSGDDKCGSYGSLVDLEEESSDWGSGIESEVDFLLPDFPSMSYKRSALNSRTSGDVEATGPFPFDEDVDMEEFNYMYDADEPLFWPPGLKSAWFSNPGSNFLVMSPPKKRLKAEKPEKNGINAIEEEKSDLLKVVEVDLNEIGTDEPLVWPSGQTFDWSPEAAWNFFNMSPSKRKKGAVVENQKKMETYNVDLEDLNQDGLLVWPSDQKVDWNSESVFNMFIMSPLKRRQNRDAGMEFSGYEPLFWPSESAFDWDHEAARNFFAMSPRRSNKISFESSITRVVEEKATRKRTRGIGGVIVSPRVVELRNGSGGYKGVIRTKSMPAHRRRYSSFAGKEGIL